MTMQPEEARTRMLRLWLALGSSNSSSSNDGERNIARACSILTTQRTLVHADTLIPNAKHSLFAVTNLITPLGRYTHAVVRDRDVALIETSVTSEQLRALLVQEQPLASVTALQETQMTDE